MNSASKVESIDAPMLEDIEKDLGATELDLASYVDGVQPPAKKVRRSAGAITPCLVAEILKFHLRELLGFGGRKKLSWNGLAPQFLQGI